METNKNKNMPGKSKKGGGLQVKSTFKMKGWDGYQSSPLKKDLPKGSKSASYKESKSKSMNKELTGKKSDSFERYDSLIQFVREDLFQEKISKAEADKKIKKLEGLRDTFKQ
tara:strand:+ start:735 stop:1070 length:336 start_codon:yes stop_codon:yes gene_type:complete